MKNAIHIGKASLPALLAVLFLGQPLAAQITTHTALPVARGEAIVRVQSRVMRSTGDATALDRSLTVLAFPVVAAYGMHPRLALFAVVPVVSKDLRLTMDAGRVSRNTFGLGDASIFARYTMYRHNRRGRTVRLAPFAGLELPTGRDDESDAFGRLPRPLQPGSGSWDPFAGAVFTWQTLAWQLDVSPAYTHFSGAGGFRFGDEVRFDVSYKYRLAPRRLNGPVRGFLYANLESNLVHRGRNRAAGVDDPDSGGTTWYLAPGFQYITRRFIFEAALQWPAIERLGGDALEHDFVTIVSTRIKF